MSIDFSQTKQILITGSTDGIGKATALALAKEGHKITLPVNTLLGNTLLNPHLYLMMKISKIKCGIFV